jgi:hypothetical protein
MPASPRSRSTVWRDVNVMRRSTLSTSSRPTPTSSAVASWASSRALISPRQCPTRSSRPTDWNTCFSADDLQLAGWIKDFRLPSKLLFSLENDIYNVDGSVDDYTPIVEKLIAKKRSIHRYICKIAIVAVIQ